MVVRLVTWLAGLGMALPRVLDGPLLSDFFSLLVGWLVSQ